MEEIPGIVIAGASGRMGQMLIAEVLASKSMRLIGALERPGHDWIGKDLGEAMGGQALGITVTDDTLEAMAEAQALIDFTSPAATVANAAIAAQARAVHVIGTTGLTDDDIAKLDAAIGLDRLSIVIGDQQPICLIDEQIVRNQGPFARQGLYLA